MRKRVTLEGGVVGVAAAGCEDCGGFNALDAGIRWPLPLDTEMFAVIVTKGQSQ